MTVFEAYITNLGKYAEGQLVGETLKFPATTEEVQSLLKNIGVDGVRYEEFFITAFDGDVMGLYDYLTEYENLDELNHLAHLISELDSDEIETLEAVLNKGDHTSSVADIINLVHNLDCYELHPGVTDNETLGRIYVEDMELLDVPDNVLPYFDFEAYGRDMRINEGGHFAPHGLSDPQRRFQGGVPRHRGHSRRTPHFCVPQVEYPGADGGLQGGHRPFILGGRAPAPEKGA